MTHNPHTLADVLAAVETASDDQLSPSYRKAIASDLLRIGEIIGAPLDTIRAERAVLTRKLNRVHPQRVRSGSQHGVSSKRITNLKTSLNKAFKVVGVKPESKPISDVSPRWRALWTELAQPKHGGYLRPRLSRLIRKMDALDLDPAGLDTAAAEAAAHALLADHQADPLITKPAYQVRRYIRAWNEAVATVPGWPQVTIPELPTRQYRIQRAAFPASFVRDVERLRAALTNVGCQSERSFIDSLTRENTPRMTPYRAQTITTTVTTVYNAATTYVENGKLDIDQIRSVQDVVAPERVAHFLDAVRERTGADTQTNKKSTIAGYAADLLRAARHHPSIDEATAGQLRRLCRHANAFIPTGMTKRNREKLAQFKDPDAILDLEDLEVELINEAEAQRHANAGQATSAMAFTYMRGLALWLLRTTSYRRRNILRLQNRHIVWPSGTGHPGQLWLEGADTKTGRELAAELDPTLVRALRHFWRHFRPALTLDPDNPYLFAGKSEDGRVNENHFGAHLAKTVARRTGLDFNFHFGRHLTAEILLSENRANMPVVSETLGHAPGSATASKHYAAMSQREASRTVQDLRAQRRNRGGRSASKPQIRKP